MLLCTLICVGVKRQEQQQLVTSCERLCVWDGRLGTSPVKVHFFYVCRFARELSTTASRLAVLPPCSGF